MSNPHGDNVMGPYQPEYPDCPSEPGMKLILELYAEEIADHASNIVSIKGLLPHQLSRYKNNCFSAAELLMENVRLLKNRGCYDNGAPIIRHHGRLGRLLKWALTLGFAFIAGFGVITWRLVS